MSESLTKRESVWFVVIWLTAFSALIGILWMWSETQLNCWDKYQTEEQAIINCEGVNK